jgi:site-specific DNA recombinase
MRRKLVMCVLDGVYIDAKKYKTITAKKPKPAFIPIFQVAVSKKRDGNQNIQKRVSRF